MNEQPLNAVKTPEREQLELEQFCRNEGSNGSQKLRGKLNGIKPGLQGCSVIVETLHCSIEKLQGEAFKGQC